MSTGIKQVHFDFNTAISGVDDDGDFSQIDHDNLVKPFRAQIMKTDGVVEVYVARFGLNVDFSVFATDEASVAEAVDDAVEEFASGKGFFPQSGDKDPKAIRELPAEAKPTPKRKITVKFDSNLVKYPFATKGGFDKEKFHETVADFVSEMVNIDGVVTYKPFTDGFYLVIDTTKTSTLKAKDHMTKAVRLFQNRSPYFPYKRGENIGLEFIVTNWYE